MTTKQDIELEAALLKSLAVKSNYDKFYSSLDTKRLIPTTASLLKDYGRYYSQFNEDIKWDVLYTNIANSWHNKCTCNKSDKGVHSLNCELVDRAELEYYRETVFPLIQDSRIENNLYVTLLEREASAKIQEVIEKGFSHEKIQEIVTSLKSQLNIHSEYNDEDIFKLGSLDLSVLDSSNGLSWFLNSLQAGLGSLMPGQFVVVSADSGAGKSAFCISQAAHVFRQLHERAETRPILYCTSEDTREDLAGRFMSNLYKEKCVGGFEEIIKQFPKVQKNFSSNYNEDLFVGMQIRNHKDMLKLRHKIDTLNPSVVIVDMLDTLSESGGHEHLKKTYDEIRGLANDGIPIIGTTQSGDTTYWGEDSDGKPQRRHRKRLSEKDAAGSKFGKQGAAYAMLMIGQDDDMPGVRYLTTTKKKRGKNVSVTCLLEEIYSNYKELI